MIGDAVWKGMIMLGKFMMKLQKLFMFGMIFVL